MGGNTAGDWSIFLGLFVWVLRPTQEFFTHMETTSLLVKLQIFTYNRHSWSLRREGSFTCHTYCDTRHPFMMVISEDTWHSHLLPSVWQWSCHYPFLRLRSVASRIRNPIFRMLCVSSNQLHHRGCNWSIWIINIDWYNIMFFIKVLSFCIPIIAQLTSSYERVN